MTDPEKAKDVPGQPAVGGGGAGKDVVGLGSLNVDVLYHLDDPALLQKAGWPVVPGGEVFLPDDQLAPLEDFLRAHGRYMGTSGGGSAANTTYALAKMGFDTGFLGVVGSDAAASFLKMSLAPVDTAGIKSLPGRSGTCLIVVDGRGERTLVVFQQANARLAVARLELDLGRQARYVHLSSLADRGARQVQIDLVRSLPETCRVSFDPGEIYARQGLAPIEVLLERSFIVFLTARELYLLTGDADLRRAARGLLDAGPRIVAVKQGAQGSYVLSREEEAVIPALQVKAVDTTGAGDVYDAGFLAGLLLGLPLVVCGRLATAAAARSITASGRECYPDASFLQDWSTVDRVQ